MIAFVPGRRRSFRYAVRRWSLSLLSGVAIMAAIVAAMALLYETRPLERRAAAVAAVAPEPVVFTPYLHRAVPPDHKLPAMYQRPVEPPPLPPATTTTVNLHLGPNPNYAMVGTLPSGAALEVVGRDESGEWLAVAFPPNSTFRAWLPLSRVEGAPAVSELPVTQVRLLP